MPINQQHTKSNRIEIKKGIPSPNEGNNGELRLGITSKGIFLYVKYGNRWYQLGDAAISSGGQFSSQGVASQGAGTLATSIDRGNQALNMGGNIVLSGNAISDTGSNKGVKFNNDGDLLIEPTGNIVADVGGGQFAIESATTELPILLLENQTNDQTGAHLKFLKDKGAAGAAGDVLGSIDFYGDDAGQAETLFASIYTEIDVSTDGEESGELVLKVANHDGGRESGLLLRGGSLNAEVDVEIAKGSDSLTSVAGKLTINGSLLIATGSLTIDGGGSIGLDSHTGNFIASKAGTEFSAANSAYAGMILGYTRIQNDNTGSTNATISIPTVSMAVLTTIALTPLSIQFIVPPSGNVEISCSFFMTASSDGAKFSLSTGTSYAELGETHTYDANDVIFYDETDHNMHTIRFAVTGLIAGTDTTYYLAAEASGAGVSIGHGRNRSTGNHFPPIILKAVALPGTIVTGQ